MDEQPVALGEPFLGEAMLPHGLPPNVIREERIGGARWQGLRDGRIRILSGGVQITLDPTDVWRIEGFIFACENQRSRWDG